MRFESFLVWAAKDAFRKDVDALAQHPLLARASSFKGKTLVVVHEDDEQVPEETTDAYINAFKPDVYIAVGFPHSIRDVPDNQIVNYQNAISDWINKK